MKDGLGASRLPALCSDPFPASYLSIKLCPITAGAPMQISWDKSVSHTPGNVQSREMVRKKRSAEEDCGCWPHYGRCRRTHSGYLRTTFHTEGANLVHPHVTDVHTLTGDLHSAALEVLLLVQMHLGTEYKKVSRHRQPTDEPVRRVDTPQPGSQAEDGEPTL